MIKIGNKEVVYSASLLVLDDEHTWIEFDVANWRVKLKISFAPRDEEDKDTRITVKAAGEYGDIVLLGWSEPLGSATREPIQIGIAPTKQTLLMMVANYRIGDINHLDLNFLLGEIG